MDEMIGAALALLPPAGQTVEFEAYKQKLYAANPTNGRDVFAHLLKRDLVGKKISRNAQGGMVVLLSRKVGN